MSNVKNFPQDWLNAFSSDEIQIDTEQILSKQAQFEEIVQSFIDENDIDLSTYVDRKGLIYQDDDLKMFAFAIFGCSRGAFKLNEFLLDTEDSNALDQKIDQLSYGRNDMDFLISQNPLLKKIISLAEVIHCEITD